MSNKKQQRRPKSDTLNKNSKQKINAKQEWPVVFYLWAIALGLMSYLAVGEAVLESKTHPVHWLAGLIGGVLGVGIGWLRYRWRGDVF